MEIRWRLCGHHRCFYYYLACAGAMQLIQNLGKSGCRALASSSTSFSRYLTCRINGSLISSTRYPLMNCLSDARIRTQSRTLGECKVSIRTAGTFFFLPQISGTGPSPAPLSWQDYRRNSCRTWFCILHRGSLISGTGISDIHNRTSNPSR